MKKHFELTKETKVNVLGITLFRIKATIKSKYVEEGEIGGWVQSDANVSGNAWVYGDADIKSGQDWCLFTSFGSANRTTTAYKTKEVSVIKISCGCFFGTLFEFETQVKETHSGNSFEQEYLSIIQVIKAKFRL
jgi:hypothetical protein